MSSQAITLSLPPPLTALWRGLRHPAWLLGLPLLVMLLVIAQQHRLLERGLFGLQQWLLAPQSHSGLWLPDYRVGIEALPLEGIADDLSALTFDPQRRSLFSVTNASPQVIELSLQGEVLRRIPLQGFGDPEAIEYVAPGLFVISDEREQRLLAVRIDDQTRRIDAADAEQLTLGIGSNGNKGFEGLAWDAARQRLFVAKERDPLRIYEVHGFPRLTPQQPMAVSVQEDKARDARLFVTDLSSLTFDARSGHLLVLSEQSNLLLELDGNGLPLSSLSLLAGQHGLQASVPQAEGVTLDDQGVLYMVSEPNLFYRFDPAARQ